MKRIDDLCDHMTKLSINGGQIENDLGEFWKNKIQIKNLILLHTRSGCGVFILVVSNGHE